MKNENEWNRYTHLTSLTSVRILCITGELSLFTFLNSIPSPSSAKKQAVLTIPVQPLSNDTENSMKVGRLSYQVFEFFKVAIFISTFHPRQHTDKPQFPAAISTFAISEENQLTV